MAFTRESDRDKPQDVAKWFIRLLEHANAKVNELFIEHIRGAVATKQGILLQL